MDEDDDAPAAAAAAASAAASASTSDAWSSGVSAIAAGSSSSASGVMSRFVLNLPPGYHFLPTNAELVLHYLRPRLANHPLPLPIFFDEHILHYHPDRLIEKYREYGEDRWFFFTRRERKHAGGSRPNRATPDNGHWNATGCPKRICAAAGGELVGRMRTLVFYEAPRSRKKKKSRHEEAEAEAGLPPMMPPPAEEGEASKGIKTEWTMYEYESIASEEEFLAACKMDAIVLCTIQKKKQKGKEGETKKRTGSKRKEKAHEEAAPADAEQGSCAGGKKQARKKRKLTAEAREEDDVQGALTETEAALERELAVEAFTGVSDFTGDPNPNISQQCFFANTSSPLQTLPPPQEMTMMAAAARGQDRISAHPSTAAIRIIRSSRVHLRIFSSHTTQRS